MTGSDRPLPDIGEEAERLIAAAQHDRVNVRLTGGLAVARRASAERTSPFRRPYKDIDLVAAKGEGRRVEEFMTAMGYVAEREFNALNGARRLLFHDVEHGRKVDVFVGHFQMCHELPIAARVDLEPDTIPLAELLLTKLQIYELNEKDQRDIFAILLDHEVGDADGDVVNGSYIARLCAQDWGLWRTVRLNVERTREALAATALPEADRERIAAGVESLWERIDAAPKSRRWRIRDRVGDRVRWYELPEEVG